MKKVENALSRSAAVAVGIGPGRLGTAGGGEGSRDDVHDPGDGAGEGADCLDDTDVGAWVSACSSGAGVKVRRSGDGGRDQTSGGAWGDGAGRRGAGARSVRASGSSRRHSASAMRARGVRPGGTGG